MPWQGPVQGCPQGPAATSLPGRGPCRETLPQQCRSGAGKPGQDGVAGLSLSTGLSPGSSPPFPPLGFLLLAGLERNSHRRCFLSFQPLCGWRWAAGAGVGGTRWPRVEIGQQSWI